MAPINKSSESDGRDVPSRFILFLLVLWYDVLGRDILPVFGNVK